MSVGNTLRKAREKLGLSAEQISERTKVQLPKIEALENGVFSGLPGGLYLDGIVRAYANEVKLPAEPLIKSVREERAQAIPAASGPSDLSGFRSETDAIVASQGRPLGDSALQTRNIDFVIDPPSAPLSMPLMSPPGVTDYRDRRRVNSRSRGAARSFGRGLLMLAVLAAIGWGAYALQTYRLSDRVRTAAARPPVVAETEVNAPDAAEPAVNQPPEDRAVTSGAESPPAEVQTNVPPIIPRTERPPNRTETPPQTTSREDASKTAPDTQDAADNVVSTRPARDVSGSWTLQTQLESTSYARYAALHLGYEINLTQSGNRVLGSGRKVTENGNGISGRAQTPIRVAGTIDGDRLTLVFTEEGARRTTDGKFVLLLDEDGTLRGRFSSGAAQSSGTVEARRVTSR